MQAFRFAPASITAERLARHLHQSGFVVTCLRGFVDSDDVLALYIKALSEKVFTTSDGVSERGCGDFRRRMRRQLQPELGDQQQEFALGLGVAGQHLSAHEN
jgi:hypothetical protein